ncbi:hypothetical protein [Photobacterium swingsii]|nr:hypothetical protein [Photobacterium swingsii]
MKTLYKALLVLGVIGLSIFSYLGYQSYRALTYMKHDMGWLWIDSQLISPDTTAMQSARTPHTKQLVFRQVDVDRELAIYLNTTYDGDFLFTFIKKTPCTLATPYEAKLTVNNQAEQQIVFDCHEPDTAIYRIAKRKFSQLHLTASDFDFELDLKQWNPKALKKDDFMQHNYEFFQKHTSEKIYPWNRD